MENEVKILRIIDNDAITREGASGVGFDVFMERNGFFTVGDVMKMINELL